MGEWTPLQIIPIDEKIVGIKCYPSDFALTLLSFLLGKSEDLEMVGELTLPLMDVYPSYNRFEVLYLQGYYPKLSEISYKTDTVVDALSAM